MSYYCNLEGNKVQNKGYILINDLKIHLLSYYILRYLHISYSLLCVASPDWVTQNQAEV
ncbi:hypothetical protein FDUTEX481_00617 [Tolypothrix sp. PCC 7601]|nr:hypothetical protein FDUTEX481_00617 [Tolypothrix sp. PCC 7601]